MCSFGAESGVLACVYGGLMDVNRTVSMTPQLSAMYMLAPVSILGRQRSVSAVVGMGLMMATKLKPVVL
jgi:hypothetical protein